MRPFGFAMLPQQQLGWLSRPDLGSFQQSGCWMVDSCRVQSWRCWCHQRFSLGSMCGLGFQR